MKRRIAAMLRWFFIPLALASVAALGGCTNPEVPAGHEGYIYHIPLMFGKMAYRQSLEGPASTGVSWRQYAINIDTRERNYSEQFELLSSDDLKVAFEVNTRIRLRQGKVREIVEDWGGTDWYEWNVKEPLRTIVRREVMKISAPDIQLKTDVIGQRIKEALLAKYEGTPIDIQSVDIGMFEFPAEVTKSIQEKIAKQQELERQIYILDKTRKEAAIRVLEALRVAKKQRIISETLDPLYVQWRAVQVYRTLAQSANKTVMMLPSSDLGTGLPLVLTEGKRKDLSAADEAYLAEIEKRYMEKVNQPAAAEVLAPSQNAPAPGNDGTTPSVPPAPGNGGTVPPAQ